MVILLFLVTALIAVLLGLLTRPRGGALRAILCGTAVMVALGSSLLAWYAWAESRAVGWTLGYGLLTLLACGSAIRQASGRSNSTSSF